MRLCGDGGVSHTLFRIFRRQNISSTYKHMYSQHQSGAVGAAEGCAGRGALAPSNRWEVREGPHQCGFEGDSGRFFSVKTHDVKVCLAADNVCGCLGARNPSNPSKRGEQRARDPGQTLRVWYWCSHCVFYGSGLAASSMFVAQIDRTVTSSSKPPASQVSSTLSSSSSSCTTMGPSSCWGAATSPSSTDGAA